jgi:hypothetical protein
VQVVAFGDVDLAYLKDVVSFDSLQASGSAFS